MDETTVGGSSNNPEVPQDDTEDVPFSPQAETGFGIKQVEINGKAITIHETHRLRDVLAVYIQPPVHHRTTLVQLEQLSEVCGPRIKAGQFEGVFGRLKQEYPRLWAKIVSVVAEFYAEIDDKGQVTEQFGRDSEQFGAAVKKWGKSSDEINLREYFYSKAFDAMSVIGPEIDLEAPLSLLCED